MTDQPFVWKDEYTVGIPALDADHKELFSIVNDLQRLIEPVDSSSQDKLSDLVDRLMHYVQGHFEREEYLMSQSSYPQLKDHRHKHHDFMRVIYAIHKIVGEIPEQIDPVKMREFLGSWLMRHILKADRDYIPYMQHIHARRKSDQLKSLVALYENPETDQHEEFVSVTVQVPYYAANTLRRCARMLRNGGDDAKAIEAASDPIKALSMEDALKIAKIVIK